MTSEVYCIECSQKHKAYIRHDWPPCDMDANGTPKNPLPCGHRRPFMRPDGSCSECQREKNTPTAVLEEQLAVAMQRAQRYRDTLLHLAGWAKHFCSSSPVAVRRCVATALEMSLEDLEAMLEK